MTLGASPPPNDGEYARKLALAILGTLQSKGILTAAEVDSIMLAARRAAQTAATQNAARIAQTTTLPPVKLAAPRATQAADAPSGTAGWVSVAGSQSVMPATPITQAQITAQENTFTPRVRPPQPAPEPTPEAAPAQPESAQPESAQPKGETDAKMDKPPVIDMQLD
ncbi:hypothetical protein [Deinococcus puniceus]|uniref:Uncharacterized protein n=1 Tax=Deinococcus puniceus TaxID=1182568 RepID=A0A172T9W0_9DEIO|nr:hypothetical protein [Deinococcus puniceus]ANE43818.1 hypothetical protein SU48_08570 [Deinococcus puniceus]